MRARPATLEHLNKLAADVRMIVDGGQVRGVRCIQVCGPPGAGGGGGGAAAGGGGGFTPPQKVHCVKGPGVYAMVSKQADSPHGSEHTRQAARVLLPPAMPPGRAWRGPPAHFPSTTGGTTHARTHAQTSSAKLRGLRPVVQREGHVDMRATRHPPACPLTYALTQAPGARGQRPPRPGWTDGRLCTTPAVAHGHRSKQPTRRAWRCRPRGCPAPKIPRRRRRQPKWCVRAPRPRIPAAARTRAPGSRLSTQNNKHAL
jgi:hypothetical protein